MVKYVGTPNVVTSTTTLVTTSTVTSAPPSLHELTFQQEGVDCSDNGSLQSLYVWPWSVSLWNSNIGNLTLSNPLNTVVPPDSPYQASAAYKNYSAITFTVPSGDYNYRIDFAGVYASGQTTVLISDVVVQFPFADYVQTCR